MLDTDRHTYIHIYIHTYIIHACIQTYNLYVYIIHIYIYTTLRKKDIFTLFTWRDRENRVQNDRREGEWESKIDRYIDR